MIHVGTKAGVDEYEEGCTWSTSDSGILRVYGPEQERAGRRWQPLLCEYAPGVWETIRQGAPARTATRPDTPTANPKASPAAGGSATAARPA